MNELSMNTPSPARFVKSKSGAIVVRCGWGTRDGRGCQETFGTVEMREANKQYRSYSCIELAPGFDRRPKGHPQAGIFFLNKRSGSRTSLSVEVKEKFHQSKNEYEKNKSLLPSLEASWEVVDALPKEVLQAGVLKHEKARKEARKIQLVDQAGYPYKRANLYEIFLPAIIRCNACGKLSKITSAEATP
jgi:hypothetical protein